MRGTAHNLNKLCNRMTNYLAFTDKLYATLCKNLSRHHLFLLPELYVLYSKHLHPNETLPRSFIGINIIRHWATGGVQL